MTLIEMDLDEQFMTAFIKDLLCMNDGGRWLHQGVDELIRIGFKGNCHNVQKDIYKWLGVPERLHNMEVLSND